MIDAERYLLTCYRYIELNPVRAQMVRHPRQYPWSSYRWHAQGRKDALVTEHKIYSAIDKNDERRRLAYRAMFKSSVDEDLVTEIRETLNKGWVLGDERFKKDVAALVERRVQPFAKRAVEKDR